MNRKKLVIERVFNAPIEKVWHAITTPDMLVKWWYPNGMSNSHISVDLCEGGKFRYCFSNQSGKAFWGIGIYQTIDEPAYLSYLDNFTDENGNAVPPSYYGMPGDEVIPTLVEFTFSSDGDRTQFTLTMENLFDEKITRGMTQGWNSMFDHLKSEL